MQADRPSGQLNLTPLFDHLPGSIREVVLTGRTKCSLHLSSLQHLVNLRQLQLPDHVVFVEQEEEKQGGGGARSRSTVNLVALTALTELRCNDGLAAGSAPLLQAPHLRRLVVAAAVATPAGWAVAAQQQQLQELEVVWVDGMVQPRHQDELEGELAADRAWKDFLHHLPRMQHLTSLTVRIDGRTSNGGPVFAEPAAAAVKPLVKLQALTVPVEFLLVADGAAVLPGQLKALTLTLGSGIYTQELFEEMLEERYDTPVLLPALQVVGQAVLPQLKTVNFVAAGGDVLLRPPSQRQYRELVEGSQGLPAGVKVLWDGVALEKVAP
jgi:hypothetical protein